MVLSDMHLKELLEAWTLVISPLYADGSSIKSNHIDLRLGHRLLKYSMKVLDLKSPNVVVEEILISDSGFILSPWEFVLWCTLETVEVPNGYRGFVETKGNIARAGIQAHNTDGHVDPGFKWTITLEIKNNSNHAIVIYPEMFFVQIYIFKASSCSENPYMGKYQHQEGATFYQVD